MELIDIVNRAAKELGMDTRIVELAERLVNDQRPKLETAYIFAQTSDNWLSGFQAARSMQQKGLTSTFWLIDGAAGDGYSGYDACREELGKLVGYSGIRPVPMPEHVQELSRLRGLPALNVNTHSESQSLVDLAGKEGVSFLYSVSIPFHFLRAFMTLASEVINNGKKISVFGYCSEPQPWDEVVRHSQGTSVATRAEHVMREMKRIKDYSASNLLPARNILDYMAGRALPPEAQS